MKKIKIEIEITDDTNGILHFVKRRNNLKNLGEAIDFMADKYEDDYMELKPEFIEKIKRMDEREAR
jgi:hypothetical protein